MTDIAVANYIVTESLKAPLGKWTLNVHAEIVNSYTEETATKHLKDLVTATGHLAEELGLTEDHPDMEICMWKGSPKTLSKALALAGQHSPDEIISGLAYLVDRGRARIVGGGAGRFVVLLTRRPVYDSASDKDVAEMFKTLQEQHDVDILSALESLFKARSDKITILNKQMDLMSRNTWL